MAEEDPISFVVARLTIIVCSSPVPSNPQTRTLRAVFSSLSLVPALTHCPKVLHLDGPQPQLAPARVHAYTEFKRRARVLAATDPSFSRTKVYASRDFLFAAHNLAAAVMHVNTTFMLSIQHDYQLSRPFHAADLLRTMLAVPVVRHVRLNMRANAPARGFDGVVENASLSGALVPLTRTCGWSDAPHVASVEYYRRFVIPQNFRDHDRGRRKFMEESIHYPMQRNGMRGGCWQTKQQVKRGEPASWPEDFDHYGTYLYGVASPRDGFYTMHRSLRGDAPQWGLQHDPIADSHALTSGRHRPYGRRGRGGARGTGPAASSSRPNTGTQ